MELVLLLLCVHFLSSRAQDSDERCCWWAQIGECIKNEGYMKSVCKDSCGTGWCHDVEASSCLVSLSKSVRDGCKWRADDNVFRESVTETIKGLRREDKLLLLTIPDYGEEYGEWERKEPLDPSEASLLMFDIGGNRFTDMKLSQGHHRFRNLPVRRRVRSRPIRPRNLCKNPRLGSPKCRERASDGWCETRRGFMLSRHTGCRLACLCR